MITNQMSAHTWKNRLSTYNFMPPKLTMGGQNDNGLFKAQRSAIEVTQGNNLILSDFWITG